ncbi:MAG: Gfo/Idh/MocA family oxidoreductase [Anaerolineales bacterium]|jgi:xylose dehydrogenase (NAD/NADP)|nr:Gfo/Idh/MocA family oxidoreductase [Chloroflexota bacterium]MBK6645706.1 Gfo/Idh/MocA family oxidoreductase [Anaerolineales bacterium]MCC6987198.1 Gfo/Idh/MocA family oxidoreductase [Anaerolineales bacterium]
MNRILNWGLLSTARINRALIPPLRASKRTRLLGVASRSLSSAETFARAWRIPKAHGSYEDLLADPEIDVIYNSLPNHLHAEWTVKALHAGKHVLCEKPLALSVEEVDAIIAAAKETGRVATEAFMYRHHTQTIRVRELVDEGAIGRLQLIKGAFTFTLTRDGNYRFIKEYGGGSLWDVGCYPISFARTIVGEEPAEVFGWQVTGPEGSDESFYGQMRFGDGVHAQFDCGFASPSRSHMEVVGTEGLIQIPVPFKPGAWSEVAVVRGGKAKKIRIKGRELYLGEVEDICDAVQEQKPPRISLQDSRANVAAILALAKSAEMGGPVRLGNFV